MPNSKTKRCQTLKSKSAYMQQALSLEAEFSVFRGDLPAVLSGIICVTLSATQILHVTETSNIDDLVTQNIIALCYPSCILDATQCAPYSAQILFWGYLAPQPSASCVPAIPTNTPFSFTCKVALCQDIFFSHLPRHTSARWQNRAWACETRPLRHSHGSGERYIPYEPVAVSKPRIGSYKEPDHHASASCYQFLLLQTLSQCVKWASDFSFHALLRALLSLRL